MNKANLKQIDLLFEDLDIKTNKKARQDMAKYVNMLIMGTSKCRLTGEKSSQGIIEKQVYDSLFPFKYISLDKAKTLIDLGTGGGLPGIPIKIIRPDLEITLLDSNRKKSLFLKEVIKELGLEKISVVNDRAEEIGQDLRYREKYSYLFCRAVAKMAVLAELALPLLATGGEAVLYKGPGGVDELKEAEQAIALCGGTVNNIKEYTLKTGEKRKLYVIKKTNNTPAKYPRKAGLPGKRPIKE